MKKIYTFITSMPFMAFLFLALAFSMAVAAFIESSYGTSTAFAVIYESHWFELLWALLALNMLNNLVKYKFFSKRKFTLAIFHVSFLVMVLGAAITRYYSFEGTMHIRENQSSDYILSSSDYFYAGFENQEKGKKVKFSEFSPKQFSAKFDINGGKVKVKSVGFIKNAERKAVPAENGEPVVEFVFSAPGGKGMQSYTMRRGNVFDYPGFRVGFEISERRTVNLFMKNSRLFMTSIVEIEGATKLNEESISYQPGDTIAVKNMFLYGFGNYKFLIKNFLPNATFTAVKSQNQTNEDAVLINISDGVDKQTVPVFGHSGMAPDTVSVSVRNKIMKLAYGASVLKVPFSIFLKDFQLDKYAGSNSPSSYASEVILLDKNTGIKKDVRIFMNNTLSYRGYKFFQSSYDTDEKGTVLSVNHDFWGTWITYLGYALLIIGIILSLLNKSSHFQILARKLKQSSLKTILLLFAIGGFSFGSFAQSGVGAAIPDIDKKLVKEFSELWVQGVDGRIEPVST
ncbi:MAG: cytochrome c biogenesis protein ResB, partial [Draconibacterium sp.]|nr:cytochrome c biogenesis protein ResB [Draconibacterium sp.]